MIRDWQDVPGFFNFMDIYDQAVAEAQDGDTLVEVGTFLGKSAIYMAERIKLSGKSIKFVAVDPWSDKDYSRWWVRCNNPWPHPWPVQELVGKTLWDAFKHCCHECGVSDMITPLRMKSESACELFPDGSLAFVFIDADHRYQGIRKDIDVWLPKVRPGGIIAGHDYHDAAWPGVTQAVDESFTGRITNTATSWLVRV